jgi:hypothetical protein
MKRTCSLLAGIGLCLVQSAQAADTPQAVAGKMLDPTQNASAFKDPAAFTQWTGALMNPATSMALAQQGMDPNTYTKMLAGMMNPATMQNYMQFTDPAVAMKWMAAGMNPNFYTALMAQGLNPTSYLNWMAAPLSPQAMNMGMQLMNPALYANWMAAPVSPQAVNTMMAPMNPNLYMNWMGAGMNPQTYGALGQMLAAPAQATAAPATQMPSPLDPAALMKMLPIPGAQPAAK